VYAGYVLTKSCGVGKPRLSVALSSSDEIRKCLPSPTKKEAIFLQALCEVFVMKTFALLGCLLAFLLLSDINAYADIEEGIIIYFSFDEIDGNLVVNGANQDINGTLEGEAGQAVGYLDMGIALNPNADEGTPGQDFVRVASSPEVNVGEQLTIAVWAKGTNFGTYRTLMSNTDSSGYALTVEDGKPGSWVHAAGAYLQAAGSTELKKDTWYHLALTFDGSDSIIYLDGKEEARGTSAGAITVSTSDFFIGAEPSGQAIDTSYPAWHGVLDEFYFYNRALTEAEIGLLMERGVAVEPRGKLPINWGKLKESR
jgi:hypothetical protein